MAEDERPTEVPPDWVLVDCDNPSCSYTVWVPPGLPPGALKVHAPDCAIALIEQLR
jgi:hypothetical protein